MAGNGKQRGAIEGLVTWQGSRFFVSLVFTVCNRYDFAGRGLLPLFCHFDMLLEVFIIGIGIIAPEVHAPAFVSHLCRPSH
jgi:hypothetical protein